MNEPAPLWRRLAGFGLLPAIAAVSPLLALPVVARVAGPEGWAAAMAGEAIGTFAGIAIAYGWTTVGPALVAVAGSAAARGRLYREALVVRSTIALVALPVMALLCVLVAPTHALLAILMGLQGALIAMSFTWFAVGVADSRSILAYDALPRLAAAALAAFAIAATGVVVLLPLAGIAVTLVGTGLYTARILRANPAPWPRRRELPRLFRRGAPVALNDAAVGAYAAVPTPLVTATASPLDAAGFASADKMLKLGHFVPITLANALQSWTSEATGPARGRRLRYALAAHAALGALGAVILAGAGTWVSGLLFGEDARAPMSVLIPLGISFAMLSLRTSMMRHLLFPAGRTRVVMIATLVATAVGVPSMLALGAAFGPVGVAIGYALTETIATIALIRHTRTSYADLVARDDAGRDGADRTA